jgi:hypothetical protein
MDPNSAFAKHLKTNPWNLKSPILHANNSKQQYVPFRLVKALRTLNTKKPPKQRFSASVSENKDDGADELDADIYSSDEDEHYKDDLAVKNKFYNDLRVAARQGRGQGQKPDNRTINEFLKSRIKTDHDKDSLRIVSHPNPHFKIMSEQIDGILKRGGHGNKYVWNKVIPKIVRLFNKINKKQTGITQTRDYALLQKLLS